MNYPAFPNNGYMAQGIRYGQNPYQQFVPQQMVPQPVQGYSPNSTPVSSREEAMAVPADFSGMPMVFADFSHGKIYVKQWNNQKGSADFSVFSLATDEPAEQTPERISENMVSKSEFRKAMEKVYEDIKRLEGAMMDEPNGQ